MKITQESCPANLIYIVKKTGTLTLNALNEESLKEWVNALQTVAFRCKNEHMLAQSAIEEDNDLYCSSYGDGLFIVTLIPSEASIRCNIESKVYMLHLTATELQLKSTSDLNNIISNWPYRFIRKYGYRNGKFTFEAGRKCFTGEGVFTLDHTNPQEVFRCMSSKMKSMKKLISSDGVKLDSCENQLHIAASMEPRSRSPLPPSPSNQSMTEFEINSTQSNFSVRNLMPICESLGNMSVIVPQKTIPNKPPRKIFANDNMNPPSSQLMHTNKQFHKEKLIKYDRFEAVAITSSPDPNKAAGSSVVLKPASSDDHRISLELENSFPEFSKRIDLKNERDYESIETITDAWKTLGINDVKHNENISTDLNDIIWTRSNFNKSISIPKIIDIDIGERNKSPLKKVCSDKTYDRLDFLSANHKTSNGYKTIVTVAPLSANNVTYKAQQNEYELINVPKPLNHHKSDENYVGYGVLCHSENTHSSANENETTQAFSKTIIVNDQKNEVFNKDTSSAEKFVAEKTCTDFNCPVGNKSKNV